eukprot:Clim_evm32s239 gene=Clim_evmTU32s239
MVLNPIGSSGGPKETMHQRYAYIRIFQRGHLINPLQLESNGRWLFEPMCLIVLQLLQMVTIYSIHLERYDFVPLILAVTVYFVPHHLPEYIGSFVATNEAPSIEELDRLFKMGGSGNKSSKLSKERSGKQPTKADFWAMLGMTEVIVLISCSWYVAAWYGWKIMFVVFMIQGLKPLVFGTAGMGQPLRVRIPEPDQSRLSSSTLAARMGGKEDPYVCWLSELNKNKQHQAWRQQIPENLEKSVIRHAACLVMVTCCYHALLFVEVPVLCAMEYQRAHGLTIDFYINTFRTMVVVFHTVVASLVLQLLPVLAADVLDIGLVLGPTPTGKKAKAAARRQWQQELNNRGGPANAASNHYPLVSHQRQQPSLGLWDTDVCLSQWTRKDVYAVLLGLLGTAAALQLTLLYNGGPVLRLVVDSLLLLLIVGLTLLARHSFTCGKSAN